MLTFDNRFMRELPADSEPKNTVRRVTGACYSFVKPASTSNPSTVCYNQELAQQLGLSDDFLQSQKFADVFSGNTLLEGMQPYAMCYGGHQFGNWAGQLGDGRAINLGEAVTSIGHQVLQLKGAGMTPYSRHADGLAVLRSSLREYLCSEAMHYLGIPTTRALSLILSGDQVERDMFYDGNVAFEKGAIVCRVAPSFIRFGSFEIFSARNDLATLRKLVDFCIQYDFPHIDQASENRYIDWFAEVVSRSLDMVVHWQRVGFVHGVMNTDNMSILGLTIDYGPYGWLDNYDPNWTPNTTDLPGRRYCFGNQAKIVHWNLFKLAEALLPLFKGIKFKDTKYLQDILNNFPMEYEKRYLIMMNQKLGLSSVNADFITELQGILSDAEVDMTLFFRRLAEFPVSFFTNTKSVQKGSTKGAQAKQQTLSFFKLCFYESELSDDYQQRFHAWLTQYANYVRKENLDEDKRRESMNTVNPCFVLRNYLSQQAIDLLNEGDDSMLKELQQALRTPYVNNKRFEKFMQKRPEWARNKAGCSMLSCSS